MQKGSNSRGELITWYLARLRNNARQSTLDRKLTPLTLVETDKTLIQELVMSSHMGQEQRSADALARLKVQNKGIRDSQNILIGLSLLASLALFALLLF